jgi:hypothetical protein
MTGEADDDGAFFRPRSPFGDLIRDTNFNDFVEKCLILAPRFVTGLYSKFWDADYVGLYEYLGVGLLVFLNERFGISELPAVPAFNVSPGAAPVVPGRLHDAVCDMEKEVIERFYP